MKNYKNTLLLMAAACIVMLSSCGKDYDDDISSLNTKYDGLDKRVTTLEEQTKKLNDGYSTLSVLATAVESGFYVTEVKSLNSGYELTLSNGRKITLENDTDNTLTMASAPNVTMIKLDGVYYWALDGMLIPDAAGKPMRANGKAPLVIFNTITNKWEISVNGGITYREVELVPVSIDNTVLLQIINEFLVNNQDEVFNETVLYNIISTFIMSNYTKVFNANLMSTVIQNYVYNDFDATIVNTYIKNNFANIVDAKTLVNVIIEYINKNQTTIINNDVLYQVFKAYLNVDVNIKKIFTEEVIYNVIYNSNINFTEIINNKITTQELINIIENKLNVKIDNNFDISLYKTDIINIVVKHLTENYLTIFSQTIVVNLFKKYYTQIFSVEEIRNYIVNNYSTLIVNNYINNVNVNQTTNVFVNVVNQIITKYLSITNNYQNFYNIFQNYIDIDVSNSNYVTIIYKGQRITLTRYGVNDQLSNRIQSIVYLPYFGSYINFEPTSDNEIRLYYQITPASMGSVISSMDVKLEFIGTVGENLATREIEASRVVEGGGQLQVFFYPYLLHTSGYFNPTSVALYVKDNRSNGTGSDYITSYTQVGIQNHPVY